MKKKDGLFKKYEPKDKIFIIKNKIIVIFFMCKLLLYLKMQINLTILIIDKLSTLNGVFFLMMKILYL